MKTFGQIFAVVFIVLFTVFSYYVFGAGLHTLWDWFVTPVTSVAVPRIELLLGFAVFVSALRYKMPESPKKKTAQEMINDLIDQSGREAKLQTVYTVSPDTKKRVDWLLKNEANSDRKFDETIEEALKIACIRIDVTAYFVVFGAILHWLILRG